MLSLVGIMLTAVSLWALPPLDMSGEWSVKLDDGISHLIMLPGTLDGARLGTPADTAALSRDEQFRRLTRRYSYTGPAIYSRIIDIPESMAGIPLELMLERVLWKSVLRIDGTPVGKPQMSLVTPHCHLIQDGLTAGQHTIEIEIDNSRQVDISFDNLAHSYTNDTQVMWNGVLGAMTLRAIPDTDIRRIDIFQSADLDSVRVELIVDCRKEMTDVPVTVDVDGQRVVSFSTDLKLGCNTLSEVFAACGLNQWNEFHPVVHSAKVSVGDAVGETSWGLRSVDNADGLRINGVPVFLRGTLECCVFPLTGTPPTSTEGWKKTFNTAREWGLNHLRFHSWCPPEAAFAVADSMGFYLQVELPVWSLKIGDDDNVKEFLRDEFHNICAAYGNHPSLCMLSVGNELQYDFDWLNEMVAHMKKYDPRRLYTTSSFTFEKGHGQRPEPEDEYMVTQWTADGWVRGQGVFETSEPAFDKDYSASIGCVDVPLVTHEIGQYAVYPSVKEIEKYTGSLNPLNLKNVRDDLVARGLIDDAESMTLSSGHLAAILYKEEIERAMKTPGISGYQLLGLQDFPGQGTALVGLVDAFWDNKGIVSPDWFRQFCAPIVPLLRFPKASYRPDELFTASLEIVNYGELPLNDRMAHWSLRIDDRVIGNGTMVIDSIVAGCSVGLGSFSAHLDGIDSPSKVTVEVTVDSVASNSWNIWVYPREIVEPGSNVVVTRDYDEAMLAFENGRNVLFAPDPESADGLESKFLPVFWSPVHFPDQAGPMGVRCDPAHPALAGFPNDGHTDWQWWPLCRNAKVSIIDDMPDVAPIVSVNDNFVNNRRLAYVYEISHVTNKLLYSTIDLLNPMKTEIPEIMALRNSLVNYLNR